jgi:hypothetical protein
MKDTIFIHATILSTSLSDHVGRAIAQAVSLRLPNAVARVRAQVRSCGVCGGQSGTGAGFLRVLRFPLPIPIPPTAPHSLSIFRGWYHRPDSGRRTKWIQSHPAPINWKRSGCVARCRTHFSSVMAIRIRKILWVMVYTWRSKSGGWLFVQTSWSTVLLCSVRISLLPLLLLQAYITMHLFCVSFLATGLSPSSHKEEMYNFQRRRTQISSTARQLLYYLLKYDFAILLWRIWFIRRGHRDFEHHFAWS